MSNDPHNILRRLQNQIHLLLLEMEERPDEFDHKERLSAVQIIGMFLTRNEKLGDENERQSGSAIRKYSGAFRTNTAHAASARGKSARSTPAPFSDIDAEPDDAA